MCDTQEIFLLKNICHYFKCIMYEKKVDNVKQRKERKSNKYISRLTHCSKRFASDQV